ncbi:hypothetical protein QBC41DRAFT_378242 [Cercophora samala]|uniref:Integral membrane protein n=1 Tax=Cercophora samala TaxID=330535 RepID=A0AA39ZNP8_9PEZI|nr:hypothetical protein QBC41DRAFT_378242 [Cercophora samala]
MAPPAKSPLPASPAAGLSPSLSSAASASASASASTAAQLIQSIPQGKRRRGWDDGIHPILRPLVRAYLLGYASTVAPRLATLLIQHLTRLFKKYYDTQKQEAASTPTSTSTKQSTDTFLASLIRTLKGGFDWHRFPTFCALLAGGSTLLEVPWKAAFDRLAKNLSEYSLTYTIRSRLSRFIASFTSAYLSLLILQSKPTTSFTTTTTSPDGTTTTQTHLAGRTLDLTLFALTRALDVIIGTAWNLHRQRRQSLHQWTRLESLLSRITDPAIFALSSGMVMWSWFYYPSSLPRAYNKWIDSAAAVDSRLIQALQRCHEGTLRYGEETGQAELLGSMCKDYNLPPVWGDPAKSVPFPCEIVHMGCGPSCEYHALSRFVRSFKWAMTTYLPLSLLLALRNPTKKAFTRAVLSAARTSTFLGTFITLFYYGVCLARTRVGPYVIGRGPKERNLIDGGVCVGTGCVLCGWSILIEKAGRRKDGGLFVAPRAMATLLPRRYPKAKEWMERVVFAGSTGVVFTCVLEDKGRVRGVLGGLLAGVLNR